MASLSRSDLIKIKRFKESKPLFDRMIQRARYGSISAQAYC